MFFYFFFTCALYFFLVLARPICRPVGVAALVLVEGVVRLPFDSGPALVRRELQDLAGKVFRIFPTLDAWLFETYNWVTETNLTELDEDEKPKKGYRVVYGLDYFDFESDRTRVVREKIPVRCPGDALSFDVSPHDAITLATALERQYDDGSDVRVHHVINRVLVIRGLQGDFADFARGKLVSLD